MARTVLADAGVLVGLIDARDQYHFWARAQAKEVRSPWFTCEAVLSEAFLLVGPGGREGVSALLRKGFVELAFELEPALDTVLSLMEKYRDVPMSLADACLVRMTEILPDPLLLTTDSDFRVYRRHGRQVVPAMMPSDISKPRRRR